MGKRILDPVPKEHGGEVKYPVELSEAVSSHVYPLIFATISGAHLYGFPSPDSDWDLRGVHVLPVTKVIGFSIDDETVEIARQDKTIELDLVTHDIKKFFKLMLNKNGYVLEQLYSPLIVHTSDAHKELLDIGKRCITRHHKFHYVGFAQTQWRLFEKEEKPLVKPLLYVFRVLLTGINLMRTGKIEANLEILNQEFSLPYIEPLITLKKTSKEKKEIGRDDMELYRLEYERLLALLEVEGERTNLRSDPTAREELEDLLIRLRMNPENPK